MTCFHMFAHNFLSHLPNQSYKESYPKSTPSLAACTSTEAAPSCCRPQKLPRKLTWLAPFVNRGDTSLKCHVS